ncbi:MULTISPECIES: elongation factor P 5-aminopentanone reductase [Anaerotruncus]|jgi:3-oxoacyl-[acyl-carrier protein] reductase|uniref:SDR family oxidoreductase n=1 Tax=Anaerotruncus colihominis TaxID=169435 RepID=A0A845SXZ0_9FIRM|nr:MULTISPECIES: SDR family NAD(P)-dependent oxidoreductase [Anaerotruncus]MCI8492718.1 SDR family oxidoreductase [Anaerotruncus sp.]MCR2024079.1 SDR family oxidoreductase [Anaerotruncus colihominis]NDO39370.1 SDR family oxidoreductase [Anaerotruncus colihominis]
MSRTVLITGASRGIGRTCAKIFARESYSVAACYRQDEVSARSLLDELSAAGCDAALFRADLSDETQAARMTAQVLDRFGHIDVLINNAGIAQQKLFCDITAQDWAHMLGVNITSMFYVCHGLLPQMIRRKYGRIINVSSIWGISGASCEVHYSASKAAVIGFTRALAKEVGPSGITVNCIAPGVIDTDMNAQLGPQALEALRLETPLGTLGTPEDIARLALFLASDSAGFITGQVIAADGGFL